ncbi:MAG: DUF418 domain-containing protein [Oxalobacteraceae bacterium]|nr:MAG: DUF418 domain-containing protein [Oxalobacteraceae bacterium]
MTDTNRKSLLAGGAKGLRKPLKTYNTKGERFAALDVLRGFALLGILLLNIETFAGPELLWDVPIGYAKPAFVGWHAQLDRVIVVAKWLFAEGKMRGLFAILFGAGAVLLTDRIEQRESRWKAATIFYRRNLWLLAFGLIHGFALWSGDILVDYSVLGLVFLYPLRHLSARTLVSVGLAVWIVGGGAGLYRAFDVTTAIRSEIAIVDESSKRASLVPTAAAFAVQQATSSTTAKAIDAGHRNYLDGWRSRISSEVRFLRLKFLSGWVLEWLGAMITGMGLYRSGYLTNRRPSKEYAIIAAVGYLVSWPIVLGGLWLTWRSGLSVQAQLTWMLAPYTLAVAAGTLANTSIVLLIVRRRRMENVTRRLAAVGRTAFSNYIFTTIICKILFSWSQLKLYGQLEYYQVTILTGLIWFINIAFSVTWLRFFYHGPLEWAWRSLTYWRPQPLRIAATRTPAP